MTTSTNQHSNLTYICLLKQRSVHLKCVVHFYLLRTFFYLVGQFLPGVRLCPKEHVHLPQSSTVDGAALKSHPGEGAAAAVLAVLAVLAPAAAAALAAQARALQGDGRGGGGIPDGEEEPIMH